MNIKFPKEETLIVQKIKNAYITHDYDSIIEEYDNVLNYCDFICNYYEDIILILIECLFNRRMFDQIILLVEELRKKEHESCEWYYYAFASLIANEDLYYIKSMIAKSSLLNDNAIKYYINDEGADYASIIGLHYELLNTVGPCLLLINFINEIFVETLNKEISKDYLMMRFFDLLNLLYEYGVEENILDIFKNTIEKIYEIQIM